jgi:ubiquinone biosynthesis protein
MIGVDMRVLGLAILVYKRFVPVAKIERVHESLVDLLKRETDYLHEAACMRRMAKNFEGEPGVGFPEPIAELTTRDVLTMTFMEGTQDHPHGRARAQKASVPRGEVAVRLVQSFYKMLFVDRFFHADPHPGNFLIEPQGGGKFRLIVLDFGAICEARHELIDGMLDILKGVFTQRRDGPQGLPRHGLRRRGRQRRAPREDGEDLLRQAPQDPGPHARGAAPRQSPSSSSGSPTPRSSAASCRS